jgi:hypothetical protein
MKALTRLLAVAAVALFSYSAASAMPAPFHPVSSAANAVVKVKAHSRRGNGLFSNWCAYNCYRVSPCARRGGCYGRYHYSHYRYDEDLPFCYRWDRDASAIDNVLGVIHPYTGDPFLRLFERRW